MTSGANIDHCVERAVRDMWEDSRVTLVMEEGRVSISAVGAEVASSTGVGTIDMSIRDFARLYFHINGNAKLHETIIAIGWPEKAGE